MLIPLTLALLAGASAGHSCGMDYGERTMFRSGKWLYINRMQSRMQHSPGSPTTIHFPTGADGGSCGISRMQKFYYCNGNQAEQWVKATDATCSNPQQGGHGAILSGWTVDGFDSCDLGDANGNCARCQQIPYMTCSAAPSMTFNLIEYGKPYDRWKRCTELARVYGAEHVRRTAYSNDCQLWLPGECGPLEDVVGDDRDETVLMHCHRAHKVYMAPDGSNDCGPSGYKPTTEAECREAISELSQSNFYDLGGIKLYNGYFNNPSGADPVHPGGCFIDASGRGNFNPSEGAGKTDNSPVCVAHKEWTYYLAADGANDCGDGVKVQIEQCPLALSLFDEYTGTFNDRSRSNAGNPAGCVLGAANNGYFNTHPVGSGRASNRLVCMRPQGALAQVPERVSAKVPCDLVENADGSASCTDTDGAKYLYRTAC